MEMMKTSVDIRNEPTQMPVRTAMRGIPVNGCGAMDASDDTSTGSEMLDAFTSGDTSLFSAFSSASTEDASSFEASLGGGILTGSVRLWW